MCMQEFWTRRTWTWHAIIYPLSNKHSKPTSFNSETKFRLTTFALPLSCNLGRQLWKFAFVVCEFVYMRWICRRWNTFCFALICIYLSIYVLCRQVGIINPAQQLLELRALEMMRFAKNNATQPSLQLREIALWVSVPVFYWYKSMLIFVTRPLPCE